MGPQLLNASGVDAQSVAQVLERLQKDVSVTQIQGLAMYRQDLSPILMIEPPMETPLRNRFQRIKGNGGAHEWNRLVATSGPANTPFIGGTLPSSGFFAKGNLPVNTAPTYEHVSAPYKLVGDIAEVTDFDQAAGKTYIDLLAHQIKMKTKNVALMEEWCIINGYAQSTNTGMPNYNALYFSGLLEQSTYNNINAGGAQFSIGAVRKAQLGQYTVGATPRLVVMSVPMKAKFNDLILANYFAIRQNTGLEAFTRLQTGLNVTSFDFGFGPVEIMQHRYLNAGAGQASGGTQETILSLDDQSETEDGNAIEMVDLLPVGMTPLARTTTSTRQLVQEYCLLKVTAPIYQAVVTGIATPTYQS